MATRTRAVLFDLGGTLYDYGRADPVVEREALLELACLVGVDPTEPALNKAYLTALHRTFGQYLALPYYRHHDFFTDVVCDAIRRLGVTPSPQIGERYHAWRQERLRATLPFPLRGGVRQTLAALSQRRIRTGIVSNADEIEFQEVLRSLDLARLVDFTLSSEAAMSCKPDPGIFLEALQRAGARPEETLFVGDSLDQDVAGANRLGIRSVLLWAFADREPPDREPRPEWVIRGIAEILELVN